MEEVNLAYKLEDGMKIHIPTKQEKENRILVDINNKQEESIPNYITNSNAISSQEEKIQQESSRHLTKININTATQTQLETLSGIGPSTAMKIISYRNENGKFTKIEDIKEVSGIGEAKWKKIKDFITIK